MFEKFNFEKVSKRSKTGLSILYFNSHSQSTPVRKYLRKETSLGFIDIEIYGYIYLGNLEVYIYRLNPRGNVDLYKHYGKDSKKDMGDLVDYLKTRGYKLYVNGRWE